MSNAKINLSKVLIDSGKMSLEELGKALLVQKNTGLDLQKILVSEGFLSEDELIGLISYYLYMPYLDLSKFKVDSEVIKLLPENLARKYRILPLHRIGDIVVVVTAEPLDVIVLDNLRLTFAYEVRQVLGKEGVISAQIEKYYSVDQALDEILGTETPDIEKLARLGDFQSQDLLQEGQRQPIIEAVNLIISEAVKKRASDIHIEALEESILVRYRIDGILHEAYDLPKKSQLGIVARLKILSGMDITKSFVPQDGRFDMLLPDSREIDFRVSSLPTIFGEKFVLRILDKLNSIVTLESLGFSPRQLELLREAASKEHGMILVTGPTGSGKTTTLYSLLAEITTIHKHIITVEDPVEYQIDGISQTQVKPEIGLTFAAVLRALLRQTPDVIMIGEIRDSETADMAIKSSLVGQLILSTLHTNDAVGALARLKDMGVERYLIASSLLLVCAQRLCRKICPHCKERLEFLPKSIIKEFGAQTEGREFYYGKGCNECNNTGYKGRIALLEALKVDDTIKNMIIRKTPLDKIKSFVIEEERLTTLRGDGLDKASAGVTTLDEILRVTAKE